MNASRLSHALPQHAPRSLLTVLKGAWNTVALWHERAKGRRELRELTPDQLRDIGLTSDVVQRAATTPFWR